MSDQSMSQQIPTTEQHHALLDDCRELARALPTSGVLDKARRPYRAIRFERKIEGVSNNPNALLEYGRGMARRTSEGLDALVEYNRLDLSVEMLIMDESKIYSPLFTGEDRAAARAKLRGRALKVEELAHDRTAQARAAEAAQKDRVDLIRLSLPGPIDALRDLAAQHADPETTIAINTSILDQAPSDVVALNRLGRAYQAVGSIDQARLTFEKVVSIDPTNTIARARLRDLEPRS